MVWATKKNGIGLAVIDQNSQKMDLVKNSRITCPTKILMPFLSFSENLLQDASILVLFFPQKKLSKSSLHSVYPPLGQKNKKTKTKNDQPAFPFWQICLFVFSKIV